MAAPDLAGRERDPRTCTRGRCRSPPTSTSRSLARGTPGLSGADLANLVNEAALLAARQAQLRVGMAISRTARDKVLLGAERRSIVLTEDERRRTAYHEAGHALVSIAMPANEPLHKVTIVPRGRALGVTLALPEARSAMASRGDIDGAIALPDGRPHRRGAVLPPAGSPPAPRNDIEQATALARRMVTEFGFSERLGPLSFVDGGTSQATSELIDCEIRRIVEAGEEVARMILTDALDQLHRASAALLAHETLSGDEFRGHAQARA